MPPARSSRRPRLQARRGDAVLAGQRRDDRVGAALRQREVAVDAAFVVGVPDDEHLERRIRLQQARHLGQLRAGFRLQRGLAGVEDAVQRDVAVAGQALLERLGVDHDLPGLHRSRLDDHFSTSLL
jgi:hypothetical protein